MGLQKSNSNATFLTVKNGKFALEVKEGGTQITTTNPRTNETVTKNYELYNSLTGFIIKVSSFQGKFSEKLKITLKDETDTFVIDINMDSDYALDFLKRLPNITLGAEVKLTPVKSEAKDKEGNQILNKEGKKVYNFYVAVSNVTPEGETESIKSAYNEDNPLPKWGKVTVNGKEQVDKTEYIHALKSNIKEFEVNE